MLDEFNAALGNALPNGSHATPYVVGFHLFVAFICGLAITWVYKRTRGENEVSRTFPMTLVLLTILIALVTQVIGDSVARAFSLVGALSIVRFRTVVRDTQDTAFVIFAVVIGMAVGTQNLYATLAGLVVVSLAAFCQFFRMRIQGDVMPPYRLTLTMALGMDPEALEGNPLREMLRKSELISIGTNKQGIGLEYIFVAQLRSGIAPAQVVKTLELIDGISGVELCRMDFSA